MNDIFKNLTKIIIVVLTINPFGDQFCNVGSVMSLILHFDEERIRSLRWHETVSVILVHFLVNGL